MYAQAAPAQAYVLRCPRCGAPIDASPDDIITICHYCGQVVSLKPFQGNAVVAKAMPRTELESRVFKYIKNKVGNIAPLGRELVYLPFYLFELHVEGKARIAVKKKNGWEHIESPFSGDDHVAVYGRYTSGGFGVQDIARFLERKHTKIKPESEWEGVAGRTRILGVQKSVEEARKEAIDAVVDRLKPKEVIGLTQVEFYKADATVKSSTLYYLPMFVYHWSAEGKHYVTVAEGITGRVLVTKLPKPQWMKLLAVGVAAAMPPIALALTGTIEGWYATIGGAVAAFLLGKFATGGDITWREIRL